MICTICSRKGHGAYACPWRRLSAPVAAVVAGLLLTACGTTKAADPKPAVTGDSYCQATKKLSWSVNDTKETVDGNRRHNAGYARRCEGKRG